MLLTALYNSTICLFFLMILLPPRSTLFPYTTLFRSRGRLRNVALENWHMNKIKDLRTIVRHQNEIIEYRDREIKRLRNCDRRSEEHTSELQSHSDIVCRLLLDKKKRQGPPRLISIVGRRLCWHAGKIIKHDRVNPVEQL